VSPLLEGHDHTLTACHNTYTGNNDTVTFVRTWWHEQLGVTHDCTKHRPTDALPTCYQSRPVILAVDCGLPKPWGPEVVLE